MADTKNNSGLDTDRSFDKWTVWDLIKWKFIPVKFGGGVNHLIAYKDGWIVYNKSKIYDAAQSANIPVDLLSAIAWIEVGGMPDNMDSIAFPIRSFNWCGPDWVDKHLTVTKNPDDTSFGSVSIQLQVAAKVMGLDVKKLDYSQKTRLAHALETDIINLTVVAKHLHDLILFDYPDYDTKHLSDEQIAVVGSRYNRGQKRKKEDFIKSLKSSPRDAIREYSSYGRAILRHREHIKRLLLINH